MPPDSFQPTRSAAKLPRVEVIQMPRSWLMPAFAVHRSAFPVRRARQSRGGVIERLRFWASTSCHVFAVTPDNRYCCRLLAARPSALTSGMNRRVSRVGEYLPLMGPAPAKIGGAPEDRFGFHWSFAS